MSKGTRFNIKTLLLTLLSINPIIIWILTENWLDFGLVLFLDFLITGICTNSNKYKYFIINLIVFIGFLIHLELVFKFGFKNYCIKNLYKIENGIYVNKNNLNEELFDKEFHVTYKTNNQGYRISKEMDNQVKIDSIDWLFIGDSFTQGAQVEYEELYSTLLSYKFPDKIMLNSGISGFNILHEEILLKSIVEKHTPKRIFLQICNFNDFQNIEKHNIGFSDYLMQYSELFRMIYFSRKYQNPDELDLGRWAEPFYKKEKDNVNFNIFYTDRSEIKINDINEFINGVSRIKNFLDDNAIELTIIQIPTKEEIYFKFFNEVVTEYNIDIEKVDFNIPYKIVKNLCDSLNIDLINLKEPFQIAKEQVFFNFDEHLNKNGHIEIANKIASKYANNDKINKLQNLPTYSRYPRYSNSTNTILFQSFIDGNSELFLHNSNGAINRLTHNNEDEGHAVFFNNDDDKFVITQGDVGNNYSKVVIWNSNSNERLLIGGDTLFAAIPSISPNDSLICFPGWKEETSKTELFIYEIHTGNISQLTNFNGDAECWRPIFKNDTIIYSIKKEKNRAFDIYEINLITNESNCLLSTPYDIWDIDYNKDKNSIVFAGNKRNNWDLFIFNIDTKKVTQITNTKGVEWDPVFMNDSTLLYAGEYGFEKGIYLMQY
tara:strand:+ start:8505 stop:10481 length:1977 start_codon:yes stop_codon:yes gene_type:complete